MINEFQTQSLNPVNLTLGKKFPQIKYKTKSVAFTKGTVIVYMMVIL